MKIKQFILEDYNRIVYLLEQLGCNNIKKRAGYITCSQPDGDNPVGISIMLNENLTTKMFTRDDGISDIIGLIEYIKKCNFKSAIKYVKSVFNLDDSYNETDFDKTLRSLDVFKPKEVSEFTREYLDEKYLLNFEPHIVEDWLREHIDTSIQQKYDIRIDKKSCRYIIPIRDEKNNLVSVKGRTFAKDYKLLNVPKYIYYTKLGCNDILFGYNFNKENIKARKEVIIFESEKSVMKAECYGFNNCVAISMGAINEDMLKKILSMNVEVVLALDKGLSHKHLKTQIDKLKMFTNVYVIGDKDNLLDDKDAPVDKGKDVWIKLYNNRKKVI